MPSTDEDIAWLRSTFHSFPKAALPEDTVEYSLYIFKAGQNDAAATGADGEKASSDGVAGNSRVTSDGGVAGGLDDGDTEFIRQRLKEVQKEANALHKKWLSDYIWQREGFGLELVSEDGLPILRGRTNYGDSIEDEWAITYLLLTLTQSPSNNKDLWIKMTDSDGDFLLIEASGTLPAWLEPEVATNRVWLNGGQLKIIKPAGNVYRTSKRVDEDSKLSVQDARRVVLAAQAGDVQARSRIMHSTSIDAEAFYRLRNYPEQIKTNIHSTLLLLPRKIAWLLHTKPAYISPAIEAFILRDSKSIRKIAANSGSGKLVFDATDNVVVSVKFPRVSYARLRIEDAGPLGGKANQNDEDDGRRDKAFDSAQMAIKLTLGFEMLLSDERYQDWPAVREMKMLLDDVATGDEELPDDTEVEKWEKKEDDENWLDISFDDLENELERKNKETTKSDGKTRSKDADSRKKQADFGDKNAQENLRRMVKQFEHFLNDNDNTGGGGLDHEGLFGDNSDEFDDLDDDSDDGEDLDGSFDEDEFSKMMQEMMGMPPEVMKEIMTGKTDASKEPSAANDRDKDISARAKARARGTLADLDDSDVGEIGGDNTQEDEESDDNIDDELDSDLGDIDMGAVAELLKGLQSEGGMPGAASSLLELMSNMNPRSAGERENLGVEELCDSEGDEDVVPTKSSKSKGKQKA